jgi:hypothetical protein
MSTKTKAKHTKKPPDGLTPISARKINLLQGVSAEDIQLLGAALALGLAAGTERAKGRTQGETHTRTVWVVAPNVEEAARRDILKPQAIPYSVPVVVDPCVHSIYATLEQAEADLALTKEHNPYCASLTWKPFRVTVTASEE